MTEPISRYYLYIKKSIRGPFAARDAALQPGFGASTLVCPEKLLGQWREAAVEPAFQSLIQNPPMPPAKPRAPLSVEAAEEGASRALLEKAITKNAAIEREVRELRKSYQAEKHNFEDALRKKEGDIKALTEKLKRAIENAQNAGRTEHPSWETLYKTLKKRSEDKLSEATQEIAEKIGEAARAKEAMLAAAEQNRRALSRAESECARRISEMQDAVKELKSQLEEKEMLSLSYSDNVSTLVAKNEELQRIMLDERQDAEQKSAKFCEEIGRLRADIKWRDQEMAKVREELFDAANRVKEFEAADELKSREQQELYDVLSAKMKLLSGYFENLESKVKYAFRKA